MSSVRLDIVRHNVGRPAGPVNRYSVLPAVQISQLRALRGTQDLPRMLAVFMPYRYEDRLVRSYDKDVGDLRSVLEVQTFQGR